MKPRAYSKESLVAFLESKDPNESYNYFSIFNCLHAQYWGFLGRTRLLYGLFMPLVGLTHLYVERDIAAARPHTFGAALERVKAQS